ncbi:MAG: bifunctional ornithine acetyltransferase/N-acetylglutamate synthase, partial [Firmicutes bacterium]|nr:bifunctional ornithine acetyltransferase/N-acetylglutamate synthase [Bacillota bacterium]
MERIEGGVTAPRGYTAAGVACGLKKDGRPDLALLVSARPAVAAGVFTANQIKGHSLLLTQKRIGRPVRAVLVNSGNANACLGPRGDADAKTAAGFVAKALALAEEEVLFASTGVIGQPLDLSAVERGVFVAREALSPRGGKAAAQAIMTTDTFPKEAAVRLGLGGRVIHIGGMAKGAGMIHPHLATLLGFLTTDAPVEREALDLALRTAVEKSFNAVTVDGDTSPCDMVIALANGAAGGEEIKVGSDGFSIFTAALTEVCRELAKMIARDGEGATKFLTIIVRGARTEAEARRIGRAVGRSP